MELNEYHKLALAVALGLLVGLQRERQEVTIAGIRTFALITLLGALTGLLAQSLGAWVVAASFVGVTAIVVIGNIARHRHGPVDPGVTTEIAALVMFAVGALLMTQQVGVAVTVAGAAAVLIYSKEPLHQLAGRLGEADLRAISRLVLIGMVILPLMPNEAFGPYDVINPFKIWLLVVLIVGISLGAYLAFVFLGPRVGTVLGGILGGLISSTATTVSYARRTRGNPELAPAATLVILLASTIVFARVLVEISVAAPGHVMRLAPPIVALMAFMLVLCAVVYAAQRGRMAQAPEHEPPSNLKAAIFFGLLYAAVLVAVAWAKENFGTQGLYIVAALSGMTDMDAITLSTSQLVQQGTLPPEVGWRAILIGSMANLVFKALAVAALGHVRLLAAVAGLFLLAGAAGVSLLVFWPS